MPPFDVGDVVVCVDDRAHPVFGKPPLRKGSSYRVEYADTWVGVHLHGVDPSPAIGFKPHRFRKIDADVTEEFREQLRKLPVREPAL